MTPLSPTQSSTWRRRFVVVNGCQAALFFGCEGAVLVFGL